MRRAIRAGAGLLALSLLGTIGACNKKQKTDAPPKGIVNKSGGGGGAGMGAAMGGDPATPGNNPRVLAVTSLGNFVIELYPAKAPITVKNFLRYVDEKFFDDTIFHRIAKGFVIQGGGFSKDLQRKKTHPPIKNEADNGLYNDKYTLSMARTRAIDSATSQFFVNLKSNAALDHHGQQRFGYAVFGKVVKGTDVIDKIHASEIENRGVPFNTLPKPLVVIKSMRRHK